MSIKEVLIIQCDIAHNRCSGFACTKSFYDRTGKFEGYEEDVRYISFTCGGCCGKGVAAKIEHYGKQSRKQNGYAKDEIAVHLASCMVTDNHHYDRCPHVDYIKKIVDKHGFVNLIEGSYMSNNAGRKRSEGVYNSYE